MSRCCNDDDGEPPPPPAPARVARARWGLLRAALKGIQPDECDRKASIHCFPGFQLLSRQVVVTADPSYRQRLLSRQVNDVESLLWAIHSCQDATTDTTTATTVVVVKIPCSSGGGISEQVRGDLAGKGILCRYTSTSTSSGETLRAWLPPNTDYVCVNYQLSPHMSLRTRERLPQVKVKLDALTSQQHHDGVDNTGNTRVWDSESTLTHCLLHDNKTLLSVLGVENLWDLRSSTTKESNKPLLHVLELGAGMAGLAGMALAMQNPQNTRVVLTDGHFDAVVNNRVNIQLTQALYPDVNLDSIITAQRLVWSTTTTTTTTEQNDFDLVVASDCTHFVEFHACLALTTAHQLRVGGVAIFIAPPRGDTLERFVTLCNSLNGLFEVYWLKQEEYSETISKLHRLHQQGGSTYYDANIHCPHLLILRKRRLVEESDRQDARAFCNNTFKNKAAVEENGT